MRGRIRSIKPEAFKDADLWDLELETGLPVFRAFVGLWCYADREGRFEWKPRELKPDLLPYWQGDLAVVLDALADGGFVLRYEHGGKVYGSIRTFLEHQRPDHREAKSRIPEPPICNIATKPMTHRGDASSENGDSRRDAASMISQPGSARETPGIPRACPGGREGILPAEAGPSPAIAGCDPLSELLDVPAPPRSEATARMMVALVASSQASDPDPSEADPVPHDPAREAGGPAVEPLRLAVSDAAPVQHRNRRAQAERVWQHYRTHHPAARVFDPLVRGHVQQRLAEGYSVEQLCRAIDGQHATPNNLGRNEQGTKYLDLDVVMRRPKQVDFYLQCADTHLGADGKPKAMPGMTARDMANAEAIEQGYAAAERRRQEASRE